MLNIQNLFNMWIYKEIAGRLVEVGYIQNNKFVVVHVVKSLLQAARLTSFLNGGEMLSNEFLNMCGIW